MSGFQASPAQRKAVRDRMCLVCYATPVDPAHLVSRAQGGCDDPLCVVPLCRKHHDAFDRGELEILGALEPHYRRELAHALEHVGLEGLRRRVTNRRAA